MQDNFPVADPLGAARNFEAIVPADADLPRRYRAIYCGGAGHIDIIGDNGGAAVPHTVAAGQVINVSPVRVVASTTATNLVGWW